ncbi:MAG: PIN domain-containing protein [Brachymonas sp.]|nr:PIN domain-containing protein [Brachymonas sp.]
MTVLVDTSVWSLALRRDGTQNAPEVRELARLLNSAESIVTTGLVLQELLQGFQGPKAAASIVERFSALPMVAPDLQDHTDAATIRNTCRRAGVQMGTIDAVLAQLCIRYGLTLLTTDKDFQHAARHIPLRIWMPE